MPSGLNVGDTLTFSLSDEQLSLGYYPGETTPEAANNTDVVTKTFTIVGIYNRTIFSEGYFSPSYPSLNIYIPDSCMPAGYDAATTALTNGTAYETNYSFVLKNSDIAGEFLQQYRTQIVREGQSVNIELSSNVLAVLCGFSVVILALLVLLTLVILSRHPVMDIYWVDWRVTLDMCRIASWLLRRTMLF